MKLTKCICANILALFGDIGFLIALCALYISIIDAGYNYVVGLIADLAIKCFHAYSCIIPAIIILLLAEILLHKITHNKYILNIPFKNDNIRYTYNILFWVGIFSSVFYLLFCIWFITRLTN